MFNIEACAASVSHNGDQTLIDDHVDLTKDDIVAVILTNSTTNGTNIVEGLCPNDCSGNGVCVLDTECIGVASEECYAPVHCDCEEGWVGESCDMLKIPEVNLNTRCCDLRYEECGTVKAFGSKFSTQHPIYVNVRIEEVNIN